MVSARAEEEPGYPPTELPIVDVLTSMHVEGAIFTSFTLSLAWFEAYLLRSLERADASKILLLVDPVGFRSSLNEGLVRGAGVRYAIESVSAPDGAFHPKIGVLWSSECLVVAVGSGNLTFAGMHRNLECWEVLTAGVPDVSQDRLLPREVAQGLNEFLRYLAGRLDPRGHAVTTLHAAIRAVETWTPRLPTSTAIHWLDNTREPIGEQLVRHLGTSGDRRLQVLSPFHDLDGAAVHELAKRLGDAHLEILYVGSTTAYPLGTKRAKSVVTMQVTVAADQRPLHAKIFHLIDGELAHVLSGSANATWPALWTTGNVEVSLLRRGKFADLLACVPGTPRFERKPYQKVELGALSILWARVQGDRVHALVRWTGEARPHDLNVGFVDSLDAPSPIPWPDDGLVHIGLPREFDPSRLRAWRIEATVTVDGRREAARAWVAFDELLDASKELRSVVSAWNRLLSREQGDANDEDDAVLLKIFSEEHARTIEVLGTGHRWTGGSTRPRSPGGGKESISIPLYLIDALARRPLPGAEGAPREGSDFIGDVEKAMRAAFGALAERAAADDDDAVLGDDYDDRSADSTDDDERPRPPTKLGREVRQALDLFEEAFIDAVNELTKVPVRRELVLAYGVLCMRVVLRFRLRDLERRPAFWSSVEGLVRALLCPRPAGPALVSLLRTPGSPLASDAAELLALLVALLMWRERGDRLDGDDNHAFREAMSREVLREALAVLDRATMFPARPGSLPRALDAVFPDPPEVLQRVIIDARATASRSDQALEIKRQLEAVMRRELVPTAKDGEWLRAARHTPPEFVEPWISDCPRCHRNLSPRLSQQLLMRRPVQCLNSRCSRWLVPSEGA